METEPQSGSAQPPTLIPGSPEDFHLTFQILQGFVSQKLTAAQLHRAGSRLPAATGATRSICHIDGKDDPDTRPPVA